VEILAGGGMIVACGNQFVIWSTALTLALVLVGCSSGTAPVGFGSSSSGGSAEAANASSSGASSGGAPAGSNSSSGGTTGVGLSSSGGASSSSGGTSTSGVGASAADGATDLASPAAGTGIQIATPDYNASDANAKNMIVQPGQEIFLCFYVTLPNTQTEVGAFQSWMSPGSSHHFIVFQQTGAFAGFGGTPQPSGTINACPFSTGQWIYATSTPGQVVSMSMPQGVGYPFPASTQIVLNMHFINPGSTTLYPKVKLNILFATNVQYQAAAMVSFNTRINVPAATSTGPGLQTVSGTCTAPVGSKFFIMSTHTHKHATAAVVNFVHGGQSQEIVHTGTAATYPANQAPGSGTDWEHPGVGQWATPNYLTVSSGDSFTYSCSYSNSASTAVTVGETAASNEMCMAIGYYFPAGTTSCN
jgi:Copper type II ascorbate-dependent monooxygenase, C-terminal domain